MKKCVNPECGREIDDTSLFCPFCGQKQPALCPNCHAPAPDGARFCGQCGASLNGAPAAVASAVSAPAVGVSASPGVGGVVGGHAVVGGNVTSNVSNTTNVMQVNESEQERAERLYRRGMERLAAGGVGSVPEAAFRSVRDAADLGLVPARHELGVLYLSGVGCVRSEANALESFEKAAKDGSRAAQLAYEVLSDVKKSVGDGMTSAVLISDFVYRHVLDAVSTGGNLVSMRSGVEKGLAAALDVVSSLKRELTTVEDVQMMAKAAAHGNGKFSEMISDAFDKVGKDGVVVVEPSVCADSSLDVVEGMQFDRGYLSPQFVTSSESMKCVLEDPFILICEKSISTLVDLLPLLQSVVKTGRPVLIIAEDVEGEALATLVNNKQRGTFNVCAVRAPGYGERRKAILEDIAILTGGLSVADPKEDPTDEDAVADEGDENCDDEEDLVDGDCDDWREKATCGHRIFANLENVDMSMLGRAKKVVVYNDRCVIVEALGRLQDIASRVEELKGQIEQTDSDYDREKIMERLARLAGGVAVLRVSGDSAKDAEANSRALETVLRLVQAGIHDGVVPSGGVAYLRGQRAVGDLGLQGDEKLGADILAKALELPLRMSIRSLGPVGEDVLAKVKAADATVGYNLHTGTYDDFFEAGLVVPLKAVCDVLKTAVESACRMLIA